ncbi:RNA and export factor-binding protein [Musa troglodytarum]|uniref:RNA and export factor-binding protein n=1 Tax=Musa troglodytarum TaxID=320322 RepID=A0A9E7L7B8_9LILI|nr:RNA and export factor-binding protein [Musa troglodytarum]
MSSSLDMSLDDIIKNNKQSAAGGRGRGRGSVAGPARRVPNRSANRSAPYSVGKAPDSAWQHDMFAAQMGGVPAPAARASSIETGTKLYISNLEYGVSNEDIKELFSEVGDLKRYSINYDRSGRSKGTAEVVFARRADALAAVKRYNNVLLDGKPMKIEIIGTNISTPAAVPQLSNGAFGNSNALGQEGVLQDGHEVVAVEGGGAVDEVEVVVNQYLLQHLMLMDLDFPWGTCITDACAVVSLCSLHNMKADLMDPFIGEID